MKTKNQIKTRKNGLTVLKFHGASIVIQSTDVGELKSFLQVLYESLIDSSERNRRLGYVAIATEETYTKNTLYVGFDHIIEL